MITDFKIYEAIGELPIRRKLNVKRKIMQINIYDIKNENYEKKIYKVC